MTCTNCGKALQSDVLRCPSCGAETYIRRARQPVGVNPAQQGASALRQGRAANRPRPIHGEAPPKGTREDGSSPLRRRRVGSGGAGAMTAHPLPAGRAPSQRPASRPASRPDRRPGSMPPTKKDKPPRPALAPSSPPGAPAPRMVRRHEYQAIVPSGGDTFHWMRMLAIAAICIFFLTIGAYFFLAHTGLGQLWLASFGREANAEAYHAVGRRHMENGSISRAIRALEIAQSKDPDKLEILMDLGKAYMGNNQIDKAELVYIRALSAYPAYPDPYLQVIDIMLDRKENYEAIQLVRQALDKTEDIRFETMLSRLLPPVPTVSAQGKRYNQEMDIALSCADEEANIYYTIYPNEDPIVDGVLYTEPIHLTEATWRLRAVSEKDGMYSTEVIQTYIIIKDQPDMPKPTLGPGKYKAGTTVRLRGGDDVEAIYYTTDGTRPTTDSKLFDENNPIPLAIGNTTIRAIAVNIEGKESNELSITYEGEGTTKSSMSDKDTVDGLTLYKTTMPQFIEKYGQPLSEAADGANTYGTYTRLTYAFGSAVFLHKTPDSIPVLAELYTNSSAFAGPRGTGIGSRIEDVIGAFRDHLTEANPNGDRVLYNRTTGQSGFLTKLSDTEYKVSYYHKLEKGQFIELTYYVQNGLVIRMEWLQY